MMNHNVIHLTNNLNSVGIELKEEDNSAASSALSPTSSPIHGSRQLKNLQQEQHDLSLPDYVITFRQTFPLHVYDNLFVLSRSLRCKAHRFSCFSYGRLAEEVASFSLDENPR
jgi:hypothetical protein